jgi:DNA-binding transcriptional MerR regulator
MNSGEIARLAGVSVRTLRHYHQVGVLPEPHRRGNGYREYTVGDLILLLRIRRLTELGLSLEEIPPLLSSEESGDVLQRLDDELAAQIALLTARRETIARLRATGARPDAPPDFAAFTTPGVTPAAARQDGDLMILLHHLLDEDGRDAMAGYLAAFARPGVLDTVTDLTNRFAALDAATPPAEIDRLAADALAAIPAVGDRIPRLDAPRVGELFAAYRDLAFNDAQRAFLDRVADGYGDGHGDGYGDGYGDGLGAG